LRRILISAVAIAGALGLFVVNQGATANLPADKVTGAASDVRHATPETVITALHEKIRTSTTADLVLDFSSECGIMTNIATKGDDSASATGVVQAWVTIDGTPVPIGTATDGKVTLCSRTFSRTTSGFNNNPLQDDNDERIADELNTLDANGFSWMALNVGSGIHDVVVNVSLTATATNTAPGNEAEASIARRILTITPTHAAVNESQVSDIS